MSTSQASPSNTRVRIQAFGRFLSGMVMPNIGAFIAWGFITACFIPTGWIPNESLARLVGPMITYLLPLLIGYTGGQMVHGVRGGVIGAVGTLGVIVGADPLGGVNTVCYVSMTRARSVAAFFPEFFVVGGNTNKGLGISFPIDSGAGAVRVQQQPNAAPCAPAAAATS